MQVIMWELMHATTAYITHQHISFGTADGEHILAASSTAGSAPLLDWHPDFPLMPARVPLPYTQLTNACLQRNPEMRPSSLQVLQALLNVQRAVQRSPCGSAGSLFRQVRSACRTVLTAL
jgi:hypothetical protein